MNTIKSVLIVAAASAALSLTQANALSSPHFSAQPVIAGASAPDQNLLAGPRLGKRTVDAGASIAVTGVKDPNLASAIEKCPMAPKAKGTPAC
jgi:hypothetical protein